jgi:tol-pal system protein YbgF
MNCAVLRSRWLRALAQTLGLALCIGTAQAGLFEDDEARRAILDLRQRVESVRLSVEQVRQNVEQVRQSVDQLRQNIDSVQRNVDTVSQNLEQVRQTAQNDRLEVQQGGVRASEEATVLRRSLLELQNQLGQVRDEAAVLRGANEQLARDLSESQRRQKDMAQALDDRFRALEPLKVLVDGVEFMAEPAEKKAFDAALALFRKSDFAGSQNAFVDFLNRYSQSGYAPSALFWLGNAQYATRDYKEAMVNFRALISRAPDHVRTPEAVLSVANCQVELKDIRGARKTLDDLIKAYPQSEAAVTAKDRLARLK